MERAIQNNMGIATSLYDLGGLALRESDYALAGAYLNESLSIYRAAGSALGVAAITGAQAGILAEQHDYVGAITLFASVVDIQRQIGNLGGIAHWLKYLGLTYLAQGDHNSACACLDEAFGVYLELGDARGIAESLCEIAVRLPVSFEAVRLFGAAQALDATTTAAPFDISGEIANTRDVLGDKAFDAALAEGRALTMQKAVADAMALLAQKVGSPGPQ